MVKAIRTFGLLTLEKFTVNPKEGKGIPEHKELFESPKDYWRMTTRKPRRQDSAKPTRTISSSGDK